MHVHYVHAYVCMCICVYALHAALYMCCVCTCVCAVLLCACTHVCACMHVRVCMHCHAAVYICICHVHVHCVHACVCLHVHVCTHCVACVYACAHVGVHCVPVYMYICGVHMYVCMYVPVHMCMCVCTVLYFCSVHACIHACVCLCARAHVYTHSVLLCACTLPVCVHALADGLRVPVCAVGVSSLMCRPLFPQSAMECSSLLRTLHGLEQVHLRRSLALQQEEDFAKAHRQLAIFQRHELHNIFFTQIKSAIFQGELKAEAAKMLLQDYADIQVRPQIRLVAVGVGLP